MVVSSRGNPSISDHLHDAMTHAKKPAITYAKTHAHFLHQTVITDQAIRRFKTVMEVLSLVSNCDQILITDL